MEIRNYTEPNDTYPGKLSAKTIKYITDYPFSKEYIKVLELFLKYISSKNYTVTGTDGTTTIHMTNSEAEKLRLQGYTVTEQ